MLLTQAARALLERLPADGLFLGTGVDSCHLRPGVGLPKLTVEVQVNGVTAMALFDTGYRPWIVRHQLAPEGEYHAFTMYPWKCTPLPGDRS